jgi:hypothetical protein
MTPNPKSMTNNENNMPPTEEIGRVDGEFDLEADAEAVSPSTASEVDLLQYQVRDDYAGQDDGPPGELVNLLVCSPRPQWHCFAHPEHEGRFRLLRVERTGHTYLVIGSALRDERVRDFLQVKDLFPLCTTQGGIFIWPVPAPREDSSAANNSNDSAREVIAIARTKVVTIRWDRSCGMWTCRLVQNADHLSVEQLCPAFFEMSWNTMLNKAFKGRIIDDPEHTILRALYDAKAAEEITKGRR